MKIAAEDPLIGELLAERFGPIQSKTPPLHGSTVELMRRADIDLGADVIDFPSRDAGTPADRRKRTA